MRIEGRPLTVEEHARIDAVWALARATPSPWGTKLLRDPVSPWGTYKRFPRRCTECQNKDLVRDGQYYCRNCHLGYRL